jgi:hypothetical protein
VYPENNKNIKGIFRMTAKKKTVRKSRQLVLGYLERISSKVFSDFPKQLTDLVEKQHGVYALYKGNRLYYVGLASNLRNRIRHHLRDKHAGKWDKFSLYLVRKADHIKELESLILRIADPTGNATRGRLARAENLKFDLQNKIKRAQERQLMVLLGSKKKLASQPNPKKKIEQEKKKKQPTLRPFIKEAMKIRATYKGKTYIARVRKNGIINFKGVLYNSPSMAGKAVTGRNVSGLYFWKYRNNKGEWVRLRELRKG